MLRAIRATFAPSRAKAKAVALPMPRLPPVTTARRSLSSKSTNDLHFCFGDEGAAMSALGQKRTSQNVPVVRRQHDCSEINRNLTGCLVQRSSGNAERFIAALP